MRPNGQTGKTILMAAFRNFAQATKNPYSIVPEG